MPDPIFAKFEQKLITSGLIQPGAALMGIMDAEIEWNQPHPARERLEFIFEQLNINSLLYAIPAEPYRSIIQFLADLGHGVIQPQDCETRTFLHDIPVAWGFEADFLLQCLKSRKGVIIQHDGVITFGVVSLEQAFVTFSSICFACFVKFFHDCLMLSKQEELTGQWRKIFATAVSQLDSPPQMDTQLMRGPFSSESEIIAAMDEAGSLTVSKRLVDSYFGNISYRHNGVLYISQTGSSLDELRHCIDPCLLDGSSCAAITASSELPAHLAVIAETRARAILHGHPKFAVILSMYCQIPHCSCRDRCYRQCPYPRTICDAPIVPGEVGAGPFSLCRTIPPALTQYPAVIVYGHGVFAIGDTDFNLPFQNLLNLENNCREEYMKIFYKEQASL